MELSKKFTADLAEFEKALSGYEKVLELNPSNYNEVEADAITNGWLQKFEYCTELCWKLGKVLLEWQYGSIVLFPKGVYRELYLSGCFDDTLCHKLFNTVNDRNKMSHIYQEEMFLLIIENLNIHKDAFYNALEIFKSYK